MEKGMRRGMRRIYISTYVRVSSWRSALVSPGSFCQFGTFFCQFGHVFVNLGWCFVNLGIFFVNLDCVCQFGVPVPGAEIRIFLVFGGGDTCVLGLPGLEKTMLLKP